MSQKENVKAQIARWAEYSRVFGSAQGDSVYADLKRFCGPSFDPNPFVTAFKEGQRSVILYIEDMIKKGKAPSFHSDLIKLAERADAETEE